MFTREHETATESFDNMANNPLSPEETPTSETEIESVEEEQPPDIPRKEKERVDESNETVSILFY